MKPISLKLTTEEAGLLMEVLSQFEAMRQSDIEGGYLLKEYGDDPAEAEKEIAFADQLWNRLAKMLEIQNHTGLF